MKGKWKVRYKVLEEAYENFRQQHSCNVVEWRYEKLPEQYLREGELLPRDGISIPQVVVFRDRKYKLLE